MPLSEQPSFRELLESAQLSAVHLEMRDSYGIGPEAGDFARWKAVGERDVDPGSDYWAPWVDLIRRTVARGVVVRRARIVSEPVTEYVRYEHAGTSVNLAAGEQVHWLSRRQASDIALPGNDFWLFDGRLVMFNHFTGDGASAGPSVTEDPATAKLCAAAFEAVWERGTPHEKYKV
ncbi:hypothetical protein I5Q34_31770 [Streptomyces sp. AV19]|uniref:DUF6879 family protein n=1 Tax=Streptomyces sp. AV19 TaxID=2793068 RepID=UPI0018FEA306|nr:DUF6879 family protein [Streptomyces sp. AV19]MBH1938786.1 hypothetical protein [Streptomyces sp. AV19]MDG4534719.1 hypothetical protein [Streptomyces sp. AV19]